MNYYIYVDDIREDSRWFNTHLDGEIWTPFIARNYEDAIDFLIHSMNPVGAQNMRQILTHAGYEELF